MDLLFLLKKVIGFLLLPLSMSLILLCIGLVLLYVNKFSKYAKASLALGIFLLLFFSWQPTANLLLRPIEQRYAGFDASQPVDYIMVLGNQVESDPSVPAYSHLSSSATARILEGIRIANLQPNAKLIVSGYAGDNSISCAEAYADFAMQMGIDKARIIQLNTPRDTREEAEQAKQIIQQGSLALVTSASHMPRAMMYFEKQIENVIAAPTFYLAKYSNKTDWRFNASGLLKSERAIYEYVGLIWLSISY